MSTNNFISKDQGVDHLPMMPTYYLLEFCITEFWVSFQKRMVKHPVFKSFASLPYEISKSVPTLVYNRL